MYHVVSTCQLFTASQSKFLCLFTDRGLIKTIIEKVLINAEKQPSEVGGGKNYPSNLRDKILNID